MRLTDRDKQLVQFLVMYGCLTTCQIANLFCMGIKNTQRRLRKLVKADYLRRVSLPVLSKGGNPSLFYLGEQGSQLTNTPSYKPRLTLGLSHQLNNSDLLIEIFLTFKNSEILCEVIPEHLLRTSGQEVIHDGVLMLKNNGNTALFMLENCAGTEVIKSPTFHSDIENKILNYVDLFELNKIQHLEYLLNSKLRRFRLLFITNNRQRLSAISELVLDHDNHGFVWLTTLSDLKKHSILGDIWHVPATNQRNMSII